MGCASTFFIGPSKVEIKEVEKIVYKEGKERIKTVYVKEVRKPDGTVVIETKEKEKDKSKTTVNSDKSATTEKTYYIPQYAANVFIQTPLTSPIYGLSVSKRFIGPITLGVIGIYQPTTVTFGAGASLGVMF